MMLMKVVASAIFGLVLLVGYQAYQNERLVSEVQQQGQQIALLSAEVKERDSQLKAAIEQQRKERRIAHRHKQKVTKIQRELDDALSQLDKDIETTEQEKQKGQSNWADESLPDYAIGVLN